MRLPTIAEILENNLRKLENRFVNTNPETRYGKKIDKLNRDIQKCSCEINGQDWNGNVKLFYNPFPQKISFYECQGSLADLQGQGIPLVWRNGDNSCHLEVIL